VRVYKPAMSYEEAREVITNYAEFVRIAERHSDPAA
jgi:putative two-component system response regulator